MSDNKDISRRDFIKTAGAGLFLAGLHCALPLPAWALTANSGIMKETRQRRYDLNIGYSPIRIDGCEGVSTGINGTVPGPLVMPLQYLVSKPALPCFIFFTTPGMAKPQKVSYRQCGQ